MTGVITAVHPQYFFIRTFERNGAAAEDVNWEEYRGCLRTMRPEELALTQVRQGLNPVDWFAHMTSLTDGIKMEDIRIGMQVFFLPSRHHRKGPRALVVSNTQEHVEP